MKVEFQGREIDLTPGWRKVTMIDIVKEVTGVDFNFIKTDKEAQDALKSLGIELDSIKQSRGDILAQIFDERCEKTIVNPTFVYEYPIENSPLAKKIKGSDSMVQRFELFIAGGEYANAFSELNDPIDQYERFLNEIRNRDIVDDEAGMMYEDYINALEIGLPPTGGMGMGIDRLVMLLTNSASIRDVLLFPTMKPLS